MGAQGSCAAGEPVGLVLSSPEDAVIERGCLLAATSSAPRVATAVAVDVAWTGRGPLKVGSRYQLLAGTAAVDAVVTALTQDGESVDVVYAPATARCSLTLDAPLAFDEGSVAAATSTCAIVADRVMSGLGRIQSGAR